MRLRRLLIAALVIVVGYLVWKSVVKEPFEDAGSQQKREGQEEMPDPAKMMARVQGLLDKVSSPELLAHITTVMNKDPGELARLYVANTQLPNHRAQ
jgi:hypothetical protein